jgi:hypothetical protein
LSFLTKRRVKLTAATATQRRSPARAPCHIRERKRRRRGAGRTGTAQTRRISTTVVFFLPLRFPMK